MAGRGASSSHFLGYNRSDAAWRAQDVATAVAALRQIAGAPTVDVVGVAEGGLWCLLARALTPGVARLAADGAAFDWGDDESYLARLFIPGLRAAGGCRTAVALGAPGELLWHHAAGRAPAAALAELYRLLDRPGALVVEDDARTPEGIVAWLEAG